MTALNSQVYVAIARSNQITKKEIVKHVEENLDKRKHITGEVVFIDRFQVF